MKYDAETFRQFLLEHETLKSNQERHQHVIDTLKDVDGMLHENAFVRGLSQHLWAQTMGSQLDPETHGKVIFHTEGRSPAVVGSIHDHMKDVTNSLQLFFWGLLHLINKEAALAALTAEERVEYDKPYPKENGLVIRGTPGQPYVLWKHEGKNWMSVRTLLK